MGEIFGEIQTTEELNELANNLRKNKEVDEIRLLCTENGISMEIADEFIKGNRLLLIENRSMKGNLGNDEAAQRIKTGHLLPEPSRIYTVEDVMEKLEEELKIYRDGDSKYVIDKLIELCRTDQVLLNAIMLPHKSYDKAFQYFYKKSRNVGYKMPHGNMVYLDNDKAVELSVEYFKLDDSAQKKEKTQRNEQIKTQGKNTPKATKKTNSKGNAAKPALKKEPEKPKEEVKQKKKEMDGQMSLFDF